MKNSFYRLEIIADPTMKGEVITKTEDIKRDLLMTSRRIALFNFEEHYKALQTGALQKNLQEAGHAFAGDTTIYLSLYLVQEDDKGKEEKKCLLQRVQSVPSANLDYDMELLKAEQNAVSELLEAKQLPHEHPVRESYFYIQKIWKENGEEKEIADIIDYPFQKYLDAYVNDRTYSKEKHTDSSFSELFIVEKEGRQQKEYLLTKGGKHIFGMGFLIERDAHWKFNFENGMTGWFGNRRLPEVYSGSFDRNIYWWWEG